MIILYAFLAILIVAILAGQPSAIGRLFAGFILGGFLFVAFFVLAGFFL